MAKQIYFLFAFLFSAHIAYGCSIQQLPIEDNPSKQAFLLGKPLYSSEISKPNYYVFIGEVVGIVKATKNEVGENRMDAEGLKVKVTENIYAPQSAAYFEIFPLRMDSDCSSQGQTGLERVFPIGSQVRVIASDATIYKNNPLKILYLAWKLHITITAALLETIQRKTSTPQQIQFLTTQSLLSKNRQLLKI